MLMFDLILTLDKNSVTLNKADENLTKWHIVLIC